MLICIYFGSCFICRTWIENTRLHDIMYEIKPFPEELVTGKVKVRGGRQELARPVSTHSFILSGISFS